MDFLLAVGWIVVTAVLGYLVTRAVKEHIEAHRQVGIDHADIRSDIEGLYKLVEYIDPYADPAVGNVDLEGEIFEGSGPDPEPEDDLPF